MSLQGKKCKKFNFFQNQNDTCAHLFTLVMIGNHRNGKNKNKKTLFEIGEKRTHPRFADCIMPFITEHAHNLYRMSSNLR